jgi:parvulin-like peptidyl-prolyl isomerase
VLLAMLAVSLCLYGQTTPDTVVATVNGKQITARQFEQMLATLNPQMRETAKKQPRAVLDWFALSDTLEAEAEKEGIPAQSPYKERLAAARRQILMQARMDQKYADMTVTVEDQQKAYEASKERYREVKAKVIFISHVSEERYLKDGALKESRSAEQSALLAAEVAKEARDGADFIDLAKRHSDDKAIAGKEADYPEPIRPTSANVPQHMRDALLAAKEGEIVGPLEHDTGFYIFRVESNTFRPFEQVKDDLYKELKDSALKTWLDGKRKQSTIRIENEGYFAPAGEAARK